MINFKNNKNNKGENVMLNKEIEFDERWNRDDGSCVLWFTAPKELLENGCEKVRRFLQRGEL